MADTLLSATESSLSLLPALLKLFMNPEGRVGLVDSTQFQYFSSSLPVCGRMMRMLTLQTGHTLRRERKVSGKSGNVLGYWVATYQRSRFMEKSGDMSFDVMHLLQTHMCWHGKNTEVGLNTEHKTQMVLTG